MELSARSYLTAGITLTAATAIAFTPSVLPPTQQSVPIPHTSVPVVRLAASATDLEALVANLQMALGSVTTTTAEISGIPGQNLIGVVDGIVVLIDDVFGGLIDATDDQNLVASLTILKTLSSDAYKKLAENLRRINPVITATTSQVGALLTSALTGSLRNVLIAAANVAGDPLSPASYVGLLGAGIASSQLLVGNGLRALHSLSDGGFTIAGIAVDEVTFQFNNAVSGLGALATQLGEASDNAVVENVVGAVGALAVTPARTVFNLGSGTASTVLATADAGFDRVLGGVADAVDPAGAVPKPVTATTPDPLQGQSSPPTSTIAPELEKPTIRLGLVARPTGGAEPARHALDDGTTDDTGGAAQTPLDQPRPRQAKSAQSNRPAANGIGAHAGPATGNSSADAAPGPDTKRADTSDQRVSAGRPGSPASD